MFHECCVQPSETGRNGNVRELKVQLARNTPTVSVTQEIAIVDFVGIDVVVGYDAILKVGVKDGKFAAQGNPVDALVMSLQMDIVID